MVVLYKELKKSRINGLSQCQTGFENSMPVPSPLLSESVSGSNSLSNGGSFQGSRLRPWAESFVPNPDFLSVSALDEGSGRAGSSLGGNNMVQKPRTAQESKDFSWFASRRYFCQPLFKPKWFKNNSRSIEVEEPGDYK
ncbi:hypothetical protein OIU76_025717 [Salix suchowensis]|nr:hypothetical protein OIU76_025717 [Salix suchowensis]